MEDYIYKIVVMHLILLTKVTSMYGSSLVSCLTVCYVFLLCFN